MNTPYHGAVAAGDVPVLFTPNEAAAAVDSIQAQLAAQNLSHEVRNSLSSQLQFSQEKQWEAVSFKRCVKN